ncbi:MAG: hypothetical protein AAB368_07275, partial [bacterium]
MIRLTASFLVLAWGVPAQAAETTPVNALNKVESTRAQAFGGAATALGNDPTLVWVNPAAPAQVAGSSLTLAAQRGYFSDMTGQGVFTTPLKPGVLTAGLLYYDAGAGTGVYQTDGAEWKQPLQQDILGAAGFAMPIAPRVTAGGLLKAMHTQLGDDAKAWGAVLDAGVHIRVQDMFKLGFAVSNLGTRVRYLGDPVAPDRHDRRDLVPALPVGEVAFRIEVAFAQPAQRDEPPRNAPEARACLLHGEHALGDGHHRRFLVVDLARRPLLLVVLAQCWR